MKTLKIWIPFLFILLVLVGVCTFLIRQKPLQDEIHAAPKKETVTHEATDQDKAIQDVMIQEEVNQNQKVTYEEAKENETIASEQVVNAEDTWTSDAVYTEGEEVIWNKGIYKARWWNSNEIPNPNNTWSAWEYIGVYEVAENNQTVIPMHKPEGFKIIGYYPEWKPEEISKIQYEKLTHINYAFAIPTAEGTLMPLANPNLAKKIIAEGHKKGVKVLLAVGGWEYEGIPLEATFVEATSTKEKIKRLSNSILEMVDHYGFDGVDMDWEHPRMDGPSKNQYAALMHNLSEALHAKGKLLSAAVVSGVTADGNVLWDAAGHLDEALEAVDYINVMAYDGGDGERHASYEFAVNSALYWKDTRGLDKEKIVLGVPFYGRPSWLIYDEILKVDDEGYNKDSIEGIYYNGIPMMKKKTEWAKDNVGGIMIWELTGDCDDQEKSLLNAIYKITMQ